MKELTTTQTEKTYKINEIFYSLQGEGVRAGTANVFIRFSGCNMRCDVEPNEHSPGGFMCDTEFVSGRDLTLGQILATACLMQTSSRHGKWLILTGGEPALQVDQEFCDYFHKAGFNLAIETNGSIMLPIKGGSQPTEAFNNQDVKSALSFMELDWITVSPKVAEHAIKQRYAHEVKYVRGYGQGIPKTVVQAEHYLISPAFRGNDLDQKTLDWCIKLCLENPKWRLSVQQHKMWKVR